MRGESLDIGRTAPGLAVAAAATGGGFSGFRFIPGNRDTIDSVARPPWEQAPGKTRGDPQ